MKFIPFSDRMTNRLLYVSECLLRADDGVQYLFSFKHDGTVKVRTWISED